MQKKCLGRLPNNILEQPRCRKLVGTVFIIFNLEVVQNREHLDKILRPRDSSLLLDIHSFRAPRYLARHVAVALLSLVLQKVVLVI